MWWQVRTLAVSGEVISVAFSPDGKRVVIASSDDNLGSNGSLVQIWNAETGAEVSSFVRV